MSINVSKISNSNLNVQNIAGIIVILIITVIGVKFLIISHAQSPYTTVPASSGTLAGGAIKVNDSSASISGAVRFGNVTSAVNPMSNNPTGVPAGISPGNAFELAFNNMSSSQQTATISLMKADGVKWLRIDVGDTFPYDSFIQAATAGGIQVMATLQHWGTEASPTTPSSYASFATTAVQKLKPLGVEDYEILNEPNGCEDKMSASTYVGILKAAYTSIKAADPSAFVITAGLCPNSGSDPTIGALAPIQYLTDMYAAGAQGYFDAVGDHPYGYPDDTAYGQDSWNPWTYLPTMHSIMASNGDAIKKIWLTEYGCPTGTDGGHTQFCSPTSGATVTQEEASEATMITDAFAVARGAPQKTGTVGWTFIGGPLFIFNWEDSCDGDFGIYTVTSGTVCNTTTKTYPTATDITPVAKSLTLSSYMTAANN